MSMGTTVLYNSPYAHVYRFFFAGAFFFAVGYLFQIVECYFRGFIVFPSCSLLKSLTLRASRRVIFADWMPTANTVKIRRPRKKPNLQYSEPIPFPNGENRNGKKPKKNGKKEKATMKRQPTRLIPFYTLFT